MMSFYRLLLLILNFLLHLLDEIVTVLYYIFCFLCALYIQPNFILQGVDCLTRFDYGQFVQVSLPLGMIT